MIAEVYPLCRMRRAMHIFDYLIPETLSVERGFFVRIPYRSKEIWGVIKRVKDIPQRGITLKSIRSCYPQVHLREEELSFFEWLSQQLVQSTASVLYSAFPQLPSSVQTKADSQTFHPLPFTLPRKDADHIVHIIKQLQDCSKAFIQVPDIRRSAAIIVGYLQAHPDQKVLILAPSVRDVGLIAERLARHRPWVITGGESPSQRFVRWSAFHAAATGILIGTRTAGLMLDSHLTVIFLIRAGDQNHKQERNPRFDMRQLIWNIKDSFATKVFCLDIIARPQTLQLFSDAQRIDWETTVPTSIVSLQKENLGYSRLLSFQAVQLIEQAIASGKRVVCMNNQKGMARLLVCANCGERALCPNCQTSLTAFSHTLHCARCRYSQGIWLHCPRCRSSKFHSVGPGNEEVTQEIKSNFPNVSVCLIDKEHDVDDGSPIILATSFYLESVYNPFFPQPFGAVILLHTDASLHAEDPTSLEYFMREVWAWRFLAVTSQAQFLVQTGSPELLDMMLTRPLSLLGEELEARQVYRLPPFYRWCRVTLKEPEERRAQIELTQLKQRLEHIPEIQFGNLNIKEKKGGFLEVCVPDKQFQMLASLFTSLPDRYIIDTNIFL